MLRNKNGGGAILIKKILNAILIFSFTINIFAADKAENGIINKKRENDSGKLRDIEIEYNTDGKILEETHRDIVGDVINHYVFTEHDSETGKPVKAVIYDGKNNFKAHVDIDYNRAGELTLMIQKDENDDIIAVSQFLKDSSGVFEEVTNSKADIYKLLKHYEDKTVNLLNKEGMDEFLKKESSNNKKDGSQAVKSDIKAIASEKDKKSVPLEIKKETNIIEEKSGKSYKDDSESEKIENPKLITDTMKSEEELKEVGDAVTITRIDLNVDKVNSEDTIIAQIFTDSIKHYTDAEVVMLNGGLFKAGIKAGKIYKSDIENVVGKEKILQFTMSGEELLKTAQWDCSRGAENSMYLNSAGLTWKNRNGIAEDVRVDGKTVDKYRVYRVAIGSSTADLKLEFFNKGQNEIKENKRTLAEITEKYMRMIKIIDLSYILEKRNEVLK